MKKLNILLVTLIAFVFTSANAELTNFEKGKNLFKEKKYNLAKFKFEQDIVFNPKNENSYLYLAKIFNKKEDNSEEEKNLKTVVLLNPKNEEAVYHLALLSIKRSNYEKSEKLVKKFKSICVKLCYLEKELKTKLQNSLK